MQRIAYALFCQYSLPHLLEDALLMSDYSVIQEPLSTNSGDICLDEMMTVLEHEAVCSHLIGRMAPNYRHDTLINTRGLICFLRNRKGIDDVLAGRSLPLRLNGFGILSTFPQKPTEKIGVFRDQAAARVKKRLKVFADIVSDYALEVFLYVCKFQDRVPESCPRVHYTAFNYRSPTFTESG